MDHQYLALSINGSSDRYVRISPVTQSDSKEARLNFLVYPENFGAIYSLAIDPYESFFLWIRKNNLVKMKEKKYFPAPWGHTILITVKEYINIYYIPSIFLLIFHQKIWKRNKIWCLRVREKSGDQGLRCCAPSVFWFLCRNLFQRWSTVSLLFQCNYSNLKYWWSTFFFRFFHLL